MYGKARSVGVVSTDRALHCRVRNKDVWGQERQNRRVHDEALSHFDLIVPYASEAWPFAYLHLSE